MDIFINSLKIIPKVKHQLINGNSVPKENIYTMMIMKLQPQSTIFSNKKALVSIEIYDCSGVKLKPLVNAIQTTGEYKAILNTNDLPNGISFYSLNVDYEIILSSKSH